MPKDSVLQALSPNLTQLIEMAANTGHLEWVDILEAKQWEVYQLVKAQKPSAAAQLAALKIRRQQVMRIGKEIPETTKVEANKVVAEEPAKPLSTPQILETLTCLKNPLPSTIMSTRLEAIHTFLFEKGLTTKMVSSSLRFLQ